MIASNLKGPQSRERGACFLTFLKFFMFSILRGLTRRGLSRTSVHSPRDDILNLFLHHDWGEKGRWNSYQWDGDKDRGRTSSNPQEGPNLGINDVTQPRPHRARLLSRSRPAVGLCACVTLHPSPEHCFP